MLRIDSHQHFWKFDPVRDSWINDDMKVIRKNFTPEDLEPILQQNNIDGCVTVQSDQSEKENDFQLNNASQHDFIKGVVGWVNLRDENVEERLAYYSQFKKMKGFRHVLQGEVNRAAMLEPAFMKGIGLLNEYHFTYDILIYADQLKYIPGFVANFPNQLFVIDHIAKPFIGNEMKDWKKEMEAVAKYENVYCKISGMVTEGDWKQGHKKQVFTPYLDTVVNAFGTKRIMFGSDWPVCLIAAEYKEVIDIVEEYFSAFSTTEQDDFFGGNASEFYHL